MFPSNIMEGIMNDGSLKCLPKTLKFLALYCNKKGFVFFFLFQSPRLILFCFDIQKADRRQLEGKVNHSLFDSTTNELNRMIRDILDKLNGQVRENLIHFIRLVLLLMLSMTPGPQVPRIRPSQKTSPQHLCALLRIC